MYLQFGTRCDRVPHGAGTVKQKAKRAQQPSQAGSGHTEEEQHTQTGHRKKLNQAPPHHTAPHHCTTLRFLLSLALLSSQLLTSINPPNWPSPPYHSSHFHTMAAPVENLSLLSNLLASTLDPLNRKQAEQQLLDAQRHPGFPQLLLSIIQNSQVQSNDSVRLAAAIKLKNVCKTSWEEVGRPLLSILPFYIDLQLSHLPLSSLHSKGRGGR